MKLTFTAFDALGVAEGRITEARRAVTPMRGLQSTWLSMPLIGKSPSLVMARDSAGGRLGAQMEHPQGGPLGWVGCPWDVGSRHRAGSAEIEVSAVRVERLQQLDGDGARACGAVLMVRVSPDQPIAGDKMGRTFGDHPSVAAFAVEWDRTIGRRREACSWSDDPWVWALTFRVVAA